MANKRNYQKNKQEKKDSEEENKKENEKIKFDIRSDAKRSVAAIFLFALSILFILGFFGYAGILGTWLDKAAGVISGWGKWLLPFVLAYAGAILLRRKRTVFYVAKLAGLVIVFLGLLGFFHIYFEQSAMLNIARSGAGGGYIGLGIAYPLIKLTGTVAGTIILSALLLAGAIVTFNFSIIDFLQRINNLNRKDKSEENNDEEDENKVTEDAEKNMETETEKNKSAEESLVSKEPDKFNLGDKKEKTLEKIGDNIKSIEFPEDSEKEEKKKSADMIEKKYGQEKEGEILISSTSRNWKFPPINLLDKAGRSTKEADTEDNAKIIKSTLKNFGIEVELEEIKTGPTVTRYGFRPAAGVKLDRIISLSNNLSMALAAPSIRIEAPIPGRSLVGIEVPNKSISMVRLGNILGSNLFKERKSRLTLALGKDVSGNYTLGNLEKMPHLMIAGATGAGKSVCINSIILSLLYQNSPEELKLLLIDPKRVELSLYNGIPHLASENVVVENGQVINSLKWAVGEMERRYRLFQETGSRDLVSHNLKAANGKKREYTDPETEEKVEEKIKKIPFIVIIIDELADLMASHGKEVEGTIIRLAQMARAVGIHLIVSTQYPTVDVLTGLIKSNITTRIALQVATQIESRTILGMAGAEKLLGNGDMLFSSSDSAKARRLQGVYVSEEEVKKVVNFIKKRNKKGKAPDENFEKEEDLNNFSEESFQQKVDFSESMEDNYEKKDSLYEKVKEMVINDQKASVSYLQRRFSIGYVRAARIMDMLEENGIVSPGDKSKARRVLIGEKADKSEVSYEDPVEDQERRNKWQA